MMALAARCELRGGARQHSRFNNCGEGGSVNPSRCPHARAREAGADPASSDADRPARAGWAALRLQADVDISF